MTANGVVEVELFRDIQSLDPIEGIAVAHVRSPTVERVAGDQDFFLWEEHEDVAVGVGTAEPEDFNRAGFAVKDETAVEGHGWQSDLHTLELGEICLSFGDIFLGRSSLVESGGFLQVRFQLFDRGRHGRDFVLHTGNAALFNACTSGLGRDDLNPSGPRAG